MGNAPWSLPPWGIPIGHAPWGMPHGTCRMGACPHAPWGSPEAGVALGAPWGDLSLGGAFCILNYKQMERERPFRVDEKSAGATKYKRNTYHKA